MAGEKDPVERAGGEGEDLYDVATWEERTLLDHLSVWLYGALATTARVFVVVLSALIVLLQFAAAAGLVFVDRPIIAVYVLLSVVPALALAVFIWKADVTRREPLELLVVTFGLGFLFAGFAAVLNTGTAGFFLPLAGEGSPAWLALLAPALYFFVVVGPVEETVKWLAIRLYAYRSDQFGAVVDGAVYGAMAGLGFATIENALYIGREVLTASQAASGVVFQSIAIETAAVRTLAGPGHVIYSAFAGYYLGLAKFNQENRGPIVVKGLLIAAAIHATYNTAVTHLGAITGAIGVSAGVAFLGFVVVYDGVFFLILYRKLSAYQKAYVRTGAADAREDADGVEVTESAPAQQSDDSQ